MSEQEDLTSLMESANLSDSLRAALRAQVVKKVTRKSKTRQISPDSEFQISLICDFLKHEEFDYTLHVFLSESGLSTRSISSPELAQALDLEEWSSGKMSVLGEMLGRYRRRMYGSDRVEKEVQTVEEDLEVKLQGVETQHRVKFEQQPKPPREQLLALERECRERYQETLTREIAYIRNIEISAARMEESRKFQESIRRIQAEYESKWQEKQSEYHSKEREMARFYASKEKDFDAERTVQNLQIERKWSELEQKEARIVSNIGGTMTELKNQQETYARLNRELEGKMKEYEGIKAAWERRCEEELSRMKKEFEEEHYLERQQLAWDKEETDRLRVSTEMDVVTKREMEGKLVTLNRELEALKKSHLALTSSLHTSQLELKESRDHFSLLSDRLKRSNDLLTLKEMTNISLQSELQTHKEIIQRLKETNGRLKSEKNSEVEGNVVEIEGESGKKGGNLGGGTDYLLGFEAWKIERQSKWRELDSLEAQIKRKLQDVETVPTEYYKDSYNHIVIPKKAVVQSSVRVKPTVKSLDNPEIRRQEAKKYVKMHFDRSTSTRSLTHEDSRYTKQGSEVSLPVPQYPKQVPDSSRSVRPPNTEEQLLPSSSPIMSPEPTPIPPITPSIPAERTGGNDSIEEEIVVESGSSHGRFGESESIEVPSVQGTEEDQFF